MGRIAFNEKYYKERKKLLKPLFDFSCESSIEKVEIQFFRPFFNSREFRMLKTIYEKVGNFLYLCDEKETLRQHTDRIMKEKYPIFDDSEIEIQLKRRERVDEVFEPIYDLILNYVYSHGKTKEEAYKYITEAKEILNNNLRHK